MKYEDIEKHLKNQLEDYQREEGNGDRIWHQLSNELDEREKPLVAWWRIGIFALLLVLSVAAIYFGIFVSSATEDKEAVALKEPALSVKTDKIKEAFPSSIEKKDTESSSPTVIIPASKGIESNDQAQPFTPKTLNLTFSTSDFDSPSFSHSSPNSPLFLLKEKEAADVKEEKKITAFSESLVSEEPITIESFKTIALKQAPLLTAPILTLPTDQPITYTAPQASKARWRLQLTGGVNTLISERSVVDTALAKSLNEGGKAIAGWSGGIAVQRIFASGWTLGSGLEFNRYWSLFESETRKAISVELKDVILNTQVDAISGDTIQVMRGDTSVAGTSERFVRHYNSYDQLSLPVQLGYLWQKGNWRLGFSGGARIDLLLQAKGKTLDEVSREVKFIDKNNYKKWRLAAQLQPSLAYQFKAGFGLSIQPSLSWSLTNWASKEQSFKQHPVQLGLSIGVSYEW